MVYTIIAILLMAAVVSWVVASQKSPFENVEIQIPEEEESPPPEEQPEEHPAMEEEAEPVEEEAVEEGRPSPEQDQLSIRVKEEIQRAIHSLSPRSRHITAVGDSLTQGVGASQEEGGYVGILDRAVNNRIPLVAFDNYGKRGNRSDQLLKRLEKPEITKSIAKSDIVLITIGANDIMKVAKENFTNLQMETFNQELRSYEHRLEDIIETVKETNPDSEIFLIGFYNPFEAYFQNVKELDMIVQNWNTSGQEIVEEEGGVFIPIADLFKDADVHLFADDNFHPNDLGYQRIAKRVLEYITNEEEE
ncbi:SGNH/GDSL hydrolase family protein [Virgibacillus xinjiangensis]|uniref:SGNH/GDSL hydrolase family protein n=1 Tax=Virgibacillus xinjiangensis TaxID=393090 RepID=A0ABV7CTW3_9BACI